jgi:3-methyladenine DNA glycosylase AlkD
MITQLRDALRSEASSEKASFLPRFFKTGPGEYGEGDQFLGVTVPTQRRIAKLYQSNITREEWNIIATSPWHEERLTALFILIFWYKKAHSADKETFVNIFLDLLQKGYINNWDLVDSTAYTLLGDFIIQNPGQIILMDNLANSGELWSERMAMVATLAFIRIGDYEPTLRLAALFITHSHDLMHKASGWMLRELGIRKPEVLKGFLHKYASVMPRTMLRYAIEKMPEETRQYYLQRKSMV